MSSLLRPRLLHTLFALPVLVAGALAGANCNAQVSYVPGPTGSDDDGDDGSNGGDGGDGGQGGSGNVPSTSSNQGGYGGVQTGPSTVGYSYAYTVGPGQGPGPGPGPTTAVTTTGPCTTCSDVIGEGNMDYPFCPGSEGFYQQFLECACEYGCGMQCYEACFEGGDPGDDCVSCLPKMCAAEIDQCFADF